MVDDDDEYDDNNWLDSLDRRRIFAIVNYCYEDDLTLRQAISKERISYDDAMWYYEYMTPDMIKDIRETHEEINKNISAGKLLIIDYDKFFEGMSERWDGQGF